MPSTEDANCLVDNFMTMNYERRWAVINTEQFLIDLQNTVELPESVRKQASRCLKHYPHRSDMERAAQQCPEVFGNWEIDTK